MFAISRRQFDARKKTGIRTAQESSILSASFNRAGGAAGEIGERLVGVSEAEMEERASFPSPLIAQSKVAPLRRR
jgi:hypothetical protein